MFRDFQIKFGNNEHVWTHYFIKKKKKKPIKHHISTGITYTHSFTNVLRLD